MTHPRTTGDTIRRFILEHVEKSSPDVAKATAQKFGISRQAVNKHLRRLLEEGALKRSGNTRARVYSLAPLVEWRRDFEIEPNLAEDLAWTRQVKSVLGDLPANVLDIWQYGFTEMFNNAIEHSGGSTISIHVEATAAAAEMVISDDGYGIFKKIQHALDLLDERHSILELSKGKLTTDPEHHTGEGIFFSSRMFDRFAILSGGVYFSHSFGDAEDWILQRNNISDGTAVLMSLGNRTSRTSKEIFDEFTSSDDYGFTKTVVPVRLAQYGSDQLISRSQAKRVLARVELFKTVLFDFAGVETIGQAFADEIFRVFALQHPDMELAPVNANPDVMRMIARARHAM